MTANLSTQDLCRHVLWEKYCRNDEKTIHDVQLRVAHALASVEEKDQDAWEADFLYALRGGFIPGGRIMASAGLSTGTTLINCFVQPIADTMASKDPKKPGIMDALSFSAQTMRLGGGVGYDFSEIRPYGAEVRGTGSTASGPVSFMRLFDTMCGTIESAGARRGAQMAILRCDHPDILEFIACKDKPGEMTNFNISVAVTDAFMDAVHSKEDWLLTHSAKPQGARPISDLLTSHDEKPLWRYGTIPANELWDRIVESTYDHAEPGVFFVDQANRENNLAYCETISSTNPCGEQPLPPYGCCDLGSIDLTRLVEHPFTRKAEIDFELLTTLTRTAVRMLDNVYNLTHWPLYEQNVEAIGKRRIGLGILGLGDALLMLDLLYDSEEGRRMAKTIVEKMRDEAYRTSVDLAKEKGAFPLLDEDKYLSRPFIARLPDSIQNGIRKNGIRNSHLLSIAPTGTIALAFADNASSGIEPPYAWEYTRKKRMPNGNIREYKVEDHAHRKLRTLRKQSDNSPKTENPVIGSTVKWKTALEISPKSHLTMVAALQPFVDSAISKTVNIPKDYPFEKFKNLYELAWDWGLKGLTTYRPNEITGSVLSDGSQRASKPAPDPDERVRPETVPEPALASLRWQRRPVFEQGNMAWCRVVRHPLGKFAIFIGQTEDDRGRQIPFEVWITGEEQPRALGALAKSLSMDMRSEDSAWLLKKLVYLQSVAGADAFDLQISSGGKNERMPSLAAGLAHLIEYRCEELQAFREESPTPVLDACFNAKDLAPGPDGTISWTVDVENPSTGDEFVLGLREMTLPDKSTRPYSLWLSGKYPPALDGLCRSLSLDMQVVDPAWIGAKLRQILDFKEPLGDFMAREPVTGKMRTYPSSAAYLARLVVHRYAMLKVLDEEGVPVEPLGVMHTDLEPSPKLRSVGAAEVTSRRPCRECGSYTLIRKDGCDFCTACGHLGGCG